MAISYTYTVVSVDEPSSHMVVSYASEGYSTVNEKVRMPIAGIESVEDVISLHAPLPFWRTEKAVTVVPPVGLSGVLAEVDGAAPLSVKELRLDAYVAEADPIFFKAQRGEATLEEWQSKIAEIRARFPK